MSVAVRGTRHRMIIHNYKQMDLEKTMLRHAIFLYDLYGISSHQYCITITPKGKHVTHENLLKDFHKELLKLKCVISYWLIAEEENTNHFHGLIQTTIPCKFSNLCNKRSSVSVWIEDHQPLFNTSWVKYCVKSNPKTYFYYNKYIVTAL